MQMDRFTTLAQQVLATAQSTAAERANATLTPLHLLGAMLADRSGITHSIIEKAGLQGERVQQVVASELDHLPTVSGDVGPPQTALETIQVINAAEKQSREMGDSFVSTEHLLLGLTDVKSNASELLNTVGLDRRRVLEAIQALRKASGVENVNDPNAESTYEALEEVRHRPRREGPAGQARPGDRARRGDPPLHAGAQPPHEEQPRAHRRARRRQDRHRRGPRPAHRQRRLPRRRCASRGSSRSTSASSSPGRSSAASSRSASRRSSARSTACEGQGHPLHRRAAHDRRRRRRRGRRLRRQPAQARPRPRRAALHRRDDPRRVPQAHREGRRVRAPLPAGLRRRAVGRGHDRDPPRPQAALRGAPRRAHPGRRARGRGDAEPPLHRRPLPARQGDRPPRRGGLAPAHRERLDARRARRAAAPDHAARDRARGAQARDRRGVEEAARRDRGGAGRARRAQPRARPRSGKSRRRSSTRSRPSRRRSTAKHTELEQAQRRGDLETAARIQYGELRELDAAARRRRGEARERDRRRATRS